MLSRAAALSMVKDLLPEFKQERERLDRIDRWHGWVQDEIDVPRRATDEHKNLANISRTPWLKIVTGSVAQCLHVDGWRSKRTEDPWDSEAPPWLTWRANGFASRQHAIHNATLVYGYSFGRVMPGQAPDGSARSVLRGVSPRKAYAVWGDPVEDDYPMYVIEVTEAPDRSWLVKLVDEDGVHYVSVNENGVVEYISSDLHYSEVPPYVRYGMPDLDGRCIGRVEPFISTVARMNKTTYDRMLIQHFNSWRIKWIAGMKPPENGNVEREKMRMRHEDFLVSDSVETQFGSLPETSISGLIDAHKNEEDNLAAISQTPLTEFGRMANLSADAIAAARAGLTRNAFEWRTAIGETHAQLLKLAAFQEGHLEDAYDETGRVHWQDMEVRSLAQAADALGKFSQMLGVPFEAMWQRIPEADQDDVEEWKKMAEQQRKEALESDPLKQLAGELDRQAQTKPTEEE